ncbi:MAG: SpoIIE family protein phosphatase [Thermonemataceae bacterium]|nr:SpoIIE family protein phosphatase [Thermonemataceae bacterium]
MKNEIRILWQSYPLPHATLVAHTKLDNALKKQITAILLNMHNEIPKDTFKIIQGIWNVDEITRFVPANEAVYEPIIQSTQKAGGIVNFLNYYEEKLQKQASELAKGRETLSTQDKEINKQKQVLNNQLIQIKNQQILVYLFLALAVFAIISGVVVFRSYQLKKKANQLLLEKSIQIQSQQEEILTQNEELHQQHEEILAQRDNIEQKNKILAHQNQQTHSSLQAAVTIQKAILPYKDKLDKLLKNYFILYQPKDIVSGDFFWLNEVNGKTFLIVADCTGHGIPGAFMTLIGNTILDKIIRVRGIMEPAKILNDLHGEIRNVLQQENEQNNYGMDVAIVCLEKLSENQTQLIFSGAKIDLLCLSVQEKKIFTLFGNRRSIGGIQNETKEFTNQTMTVPVGTIIYVGTDGLKDQNNEKRKKFGFKRLVECLEQTASLGFEIQKEKIQETLHQYMENTTQRDDILWIGFQI